MACHLIVDISRDAWCLQVETICIPEISDEPWILDEATPADTGARKEDVNIVFAFGKCVRCMNDFESIDTQLFREECEFVCYCDVEVDSPVIC